MNQPDLLASLIPLISVFNDLQIDYHIGGSVASSAYGIPRATLDIDVIADMHLRHALPLTRSLEKTYYIEEAMVKSAIERRASFNIIHLETILKLDVFILKNTPYDRLAFSRKIKDRLTEQDETPFFNFSSCEDVILNKLQWFRMGDGVSERQWLDVLGVMKVQGEALDRDYLHRWAAELGVMDLLEQAFIDAGSKPEKQ